MEINAKYFLTVQKGCARKYIRVLFDSERKMNFTQLNSIIKENFGIEKDPIYITPSGFEIKNEDVVDYVKQFISSPCFILYVKDDNINSQPIKCDLQNLNILPQQEKLFDYYLESQNVIDNIFNNLETKDELIAFLKTECKAVCQVYMKTKKLTDSDRKIISKSIIRQLLNINPNRMLQRADFLRLADWITQIFEEDHSEVYYQKYSNGKIASGKLYDAYTNQRKKLAKCGIIKRRSRTSKCEKQ